MGDKAVNFLKLVPLEVRQNWLREVSRQDDIIEILTTSFDEFSHFTGIFDWDNSELGYEYWYNVTFLNGGYDE